MINVIREFTIKGLFNSQNITLNFDKNDNELILVGENGTGKTTVMSILYHTLQGDFQKLEKYNFHAIKLEFESDDIISFSKFDLEMLLKYNNIDSIVRIKRRLRSTIDNTVTLHEVFSEISDKTFDESEISSNFLSDRLGYRGHRFEKKINRDFYNLINHPEVVFEEFKETLKSNLNGLDILYFPTYRRVEEDLRNLDLDHQLIDDDMDFDFEVSGDTEIPIKFGMNDVNERFESIKAEVGRLSSKGLNNLSAEMLRQLVRGNLTEKPDMTGISINDVQIVIERLGGMFDKKDKARILYLVKTGNYPESDNLLMYFLSKLVEVYEEQKDIDLYTDKFVEVCNKYLEQTKLKYDKSAVDIYAYSNKSEEKIELGSLSSGEQQIVSLFSRIYLNKDKKYIILFDEPELSLSIFWQMTLLPDMISSGKISFLLAVTHSPFIYDNKLKSKAKNLMDFSSAMETVHVNAC